MPPLPRLLAVAVALAAAAPVLAQPMQPGPPAPAPTATDVTAVFAEDAPRIDGRIDDAVWQGIAPVTGFVQVWPDDGAPETERTEVRVAYDRDYLYFAFSCYDREAALIRAQNLERGGRNDRDDHVYIALDTYRDGRNAYLFEMNALGTQDDATITDEELTIDSFSWDAVFRSESVIDERGWFMEVAIPFRQLRFPEGEELQFGLMLSRMVNRKNERGMWPRIGLEFGNSFTALAAVSQYGTLRGLRGVARGHNVEIKPYVITGVQQARPDLAVEDTETDFTRDLGVDVKYGLSSTLTLDATVNTDFAQVEADNVQLDLSRFSLFFPEKREFFLERGGLFDHGNLRSTQTFFSRRIGLAEQILAGVRLTGQVGPFSGGVLNIETGEGMGDLLGPGSTNNTVARVQTSPLPRMAVGAIATNLEADTLYNRALGVDAEARFWSNSAVNGWATTVWDADSLRDGQAAGHLGLRLQNERYGAQATFTSVGTHYAPALGFVRRRDMRQYTGRLHFSPLVRIAALPFIRRFVLQGDVDFVEGQDGETQSTLGRAQVRTDFNQRDFVLLHAERQFERLEEPFAIRPDAVIPVGDYAFVTGGVHGETDSSRPLSGAVGLSTGAFFGGRRTDVSGFLSWRQSRHLVLDGGVDHSVIDLPVENGAFSATALSLSALGALSRTLFAKALVQYDSFSRDVQANVRIDWIHTPGSDLFVVFNTSHHVFGDADVRFDPRRDVALNQQVAVLKLTYLVLL
jgi:hypothetical protein